MSSANGIAIGCHGSANSPTAASSTKALGEKPGGIMPALLARLLPGEMGEGFLLVSRGVHPAKLLATGYQFRFPELEQAMRHEMERLNTGLLPQSRVARERG